MTTDPHTAGRRSAVDRHPAARSGPESPARKLPPATTKHAVAGRKPIAPTGQSTTAETSPVPLRAGGGGTLSLEERFWMPADAGGAETNGESVPPTVDKLLHGGDLQASDDLPCLRKPVALPSYAISPRRT